MIWKIKNETIRTRRCNWSEPNWHGHENNRVYFFYIMLHCPPCLKQLASFSAFLSFYVLTPDLWWCQYQSGQANTFRLKKILTSLFRLCYFFWVQTFQTKEELYKYKMLGLFREWWGQRWSMCYWIVSINAYSIKLNWISRLHSSALWFNHIYTAEYHHHLDSTLHKAGLMSVKLNKCGGHENK